MNIADALAYNRSISTLGKLFTLAISDNEIGSQGMEHIANSLKVNTTLHKLGKQLCRHQPQ